MNSTSFDGSRVDSQEATLPKKKFSEALILKRRSLFKALCDATAKDGRKEALFGMLDVNAYKDESCVACRPLLKTFAAGCKAGFVKAPKKGEPVATPTSIPKQREPNLEAISYASTLFTLLADDAKDLGFGEEMLGAMHRLTAVLTAKEGRTIAEQEYYSLISHYANTPFQTLTKALQAQKQELPKFGEQERGQSLNELFGR